MPKDKSRDPHAPELPRISGPSAEHSAASDFVVHELGICAFNHMNLGPLLAFTDLLY